MSSRPRRVSGIGALTLALGLCVAQPVNAGDLDGVLNLLRRELATPSGYADNYVENRALTRLDSERATLHARITAALSTGRLIPAAARNLRGKLESNATLQAQYASDGVFTYPEALSVWSGLNNIDGGLIATANRGGSRPGAGAAELDRLTARVSNRLEGDRTGRRLTAYEYRRLRKQLDNIRSDRRKLAHSGGRLTLKEVLALMGRLNNLNRQAISQASDRQLAGRGNRYWY